MANPKGPPEYTRFKPGKSGNPGGKPKVPNDLKEARKLNQIELERTVNRYLFADRETLQKAIKNPSTPVMELMVASIMAQAIRLGDQQRLEFILSRLIGKVKDQIEVTAVKPYVINNLDGTQTVLGASPPMLEAANEHVVEAIKVEKEGIDWKDP